MSTTDREHTGSRASHETYFLGKSANAFTRRCRVLLAGIPQRPSAFTPIDNRRSYPEKEMKFWIGWQSMDTLPRANVKMQIELPLWVPGTPKLSP
jgi:membrane carboxypeptidase/penicillin-binding protein